MGLLGEAGYAVTEAANGPQALEILRAGGRFDLALVDYAMPGMSGRELVQLARDIAPELRILYVTGYADPVSGENEQVLGKPYTTPELLRALSVVLRRGVPAEASAS